MPKINLLDKSVAELIAAGEVVERPASVIKELVENSIDAGSKHITVEIKSGGIVFMRITDDGCGISRNDVPLAFMRHATSKIKNADDLDSIMTLGFRGEALAATSSVSRVEMLTRTAEESVGTHYIIEGGVEALYEDTGCPIGTTIIVSDLFYNTPARMKFLKKDVGEGNAVAGVIERLALANPHIAFKFIRDGKQTLHTSGDGKLESAVYSVLGREYSQSFIPVKGELSGITVSGFVCKPVSCRQSRNGQYVFLNGRYIYSGTVIKAVEQAYKNSAMIGKFPSFVLNITVPPMTVDVNVHPAKTEVRFSDERRIFEAVHYAAKSAIASGDTRPVINPGVNRISGGGFIRMSASEYRQQVMKVETEKKKETITSNEIAKNTAIKENFTAKENVPQRLNDYSVTSSAQTLPKKENPFTKENIEPKTEPIISKTPSVDILFEDSQEKAEKEIIEENIITEPLVVDKPIRLIGEVFKTYIIVEKGESVFLIDKHAAHERIIYEELRSSQTIEMQDLLIPQNVTLAFAEYDAVISNLDILHKAGFDIEDFGNSTVMVRAVPSTLVKEDVSSIVEEAAVSLAQIGSVQIDKLDRLYYTVACKAATKAGYKSGDSEMLQLAKQVLKDESIMYCPHGRPVSFEIKRKDLEKKFGRIQ